MFEFEAPHKGRLALSEHGKVLAVVCQDYETPRKDTNEREYRVSVCNPNNGQPYGTYVGHMPHELELEAITVDDACQCLTLWLKSGSSIFQLIHDLQDGRLLPFRCDFRKNSKRSKFEDFEDVFVNGERTLMLCVSGSRCSLWRYTSATVEDAENTLNVDLFDFGLIDTTGLLPGFDLAQGFEYRIDAWNAHRLMRLLDQMRPDAKAEYLLCRPSETEKTFVESRAKMALLQEADAAEKSNNQIIALGCLNKYCSIRRTYPEPIMQRRHDLARSLDDVHIESAWHHDTHNQYWDSNAFGLLPNGTNRVDLLQHRGFETISLPNFDCPDFNVRCLRNPYSLRWGDKNHDKEFSVGVSKCGENGENRVLALVHNCSRSAANRLVLYDLNDCLAPRSEWSFQLSDDSWPEQSHLRKIARCGETVYVEVQPGVVEARDLQTGHTRARVRVGIGIQFLKSLQLPSGKTILFVACLPTGCKILDAALKPCEDWSHAEDAVRELSPVEAVADDLSAVVGRLGPHRLVHIRLKDGRSTELWNRIESKYPDSNVFYNPVPRHVVMSPCGKAVACMLWQYILILDVLSQRIVLRWERPWDDGIALGFDGSGRWLVFAHADNQFEVFQLAWNAGNTPWNRGMASEDTE